MSITHDLHQIQLNEWAIRFEEQKVSGLTVKEWCKQNNFTIHKYNYWKHLLKQELVTQVLPDIVPVSMPTNPMSIDNHFQLSNDKTHIDSATLTTSAIRATDSTVNLKMNGISFELDSSTPEEFLCSLIKAVRHA